MDMNSLATPTSTPGMNPRKDGLANIVLLGSSFIGGGSVVYAAVELVRAQPERAFPLLQAWGPWFFLAMFVAWAVSRIFNRGLDLLERVGDRVADSMEKMAAEQKNQAIALQASADKDDRQVQEMQTLTSLTAQRSEKTYAMLQEYHSDLLETLRRIETKVDTKIAGAEQSRT